MYKYDRFPLCRFVLSSRVRTGRAIRGLRLPPSCTRAERREVERVIVEALNTLHGEFKGRYYPLKKMAAEEHQKLVEVRSHLPAVLVALLLLMHTTLCTL